MARWDFKLPEIGEGVTEGEVVSWLVAVGDTVKEDQPLVEIMTDKATVTITAPKAGTVLELRGKVGEVVQVHGVLVVFDLAGGAPVAKAHGASNGALPASAVDAAAAPVAASPAAAPSAAAPSSRSAAGPVAAGGSASRGSREDGYFNDKPLATPATRKAARDLEIDLKRVPPSGPQGRVTKADVMAYAKAPPTDVVAGPSVPAAAAVRDAVRIVPPSQGHAALEERVPFAGMRRKIAQKMSQSKQTAAHFTFVEECDVTALKQLRARLKPQADAHGVKLTFLPFLVKATVAALKKHAVLNSALDESTNELVYRKYYNIGMATSTDAGLLVPVIKDADRKSLLEIARDIERLAADAKAGKARVEDLQGSTFTITSLGAEGGLFATPIINFPEVGILGVHQMKQKPVVRDGQIVIGDVMLLSLSFDHRIVDGHVGAAFAYEIIRFLENPDRLFLEMA